MINTVIFDMDGLMFDTESVFVKACDYAGEKIGVGKAGYMVMKTLGCNIGMSRKIWLDEFGDKYDEDDLRFHTKAFLEIYYKENDIAVKKGLYELLEFLKEKKYKCCVASSTNEREVRKYLKDAKVLEYFSGIVCGDMVEQSKPNPEIYLKACSLMEENSSDCLALEDSKNGILSAYRAGCKTIMIPDLWQPDEEVESILYAKVQCLSDVIGILK